MVCRDFGDCRLPALPAPFHAEKAARRQLADNSRRLGDLPQMLYGEGRHALLIVLQGMDATGKDGTCWHVLSAMNPQGTVVKGFKKPTAKESGRAIATF